MIVREQPSALLLFFALQGSIVPKIAGNIVIVVLFTTCLAAVDTLGFQLFYLPVTAMSIFGIALSLILGFRNSTAYERWWEARKLWGTLISCSRTIFRDVHVYVTDEGSKERIVGHVVAFVHLSRGGLRNVEVSKELVGWVSSQDAKNLSEKDNPADAALQRIGEEVGSLSAKGHLTGYTQIKLLDALEKLTLAQTGCERISSTPVPYVYSLLVRRTTFLYCLLLPFAMLDTAGFLAPVLAAIVAYVFFGLQAVSVELESPFRCTDNGVSLDAMCRAVEIRAAETLGRPIPERKMPTNYVLT